MSAFDQEAVNELITLNETMADFVKSQTGGYNTPKSNKPKKLPELKEREKADKEFTDLQKKITKATTKFFEKEKEQNAEELKIRNNMLEEEKAYIKAHGSATKQLKLSSVEAKNAIAKSITGKFSSNLGKAGKSFDALTASSPRAALSIAGLGIAAGAVAGKIMNMLDTFRDVSNAGVHVAGGLEGIMAASSGMNMSMAKFTELASANARTFNMMGAANISKQSKEMSNSMGALGLTTVETSEYLAEYLESQRLTGHLSKTSLASQAASAATLMAQTDKLSVAFGRSKSAITSGVMESFKDPMIKASMLGNSMAKKAFEQSQAFFQAASPALADSISEMVGSTLPTLTDAFQSAASVGAGGVAHAMAEYAEKIKKGMSVTEGEIAQKSMLQKMARQDIGILRLQASAGNANAKVILAQVLAAREALRVYKPLTKTQLTDMANKKAAGTVIKNLTDSFAVFGDTLMVGFAKQMGKDGMEGLSKKFKNAAEFISTEIIPKFIKVASIVGTVVKWISKIPWEVFAGVATAFAAFKVAKLFSGTKIVAGIVNVFGKSVNRLGSKTPGGKMSTTNRSRNAYTKTKATGLSVNKPALSLKDKASLKLSNAADKMSSMVKGTMGKAGNTMGNLGSSAKLAASNAMTSAKFHVGTVQSKIAKAGANAAKYIPALAKNTLGKAGNLIKKIPGLTAAIGVFSGVMTGATSFTNTMDKTGDGILSSLTAAKDGSAAFFSSAIGGLADLGDFLSFGVLDMRGAYDSASDFIGETIAKAGSGLGDYMYDWFGPDTTEVATVMPSNNKKQKTPPLSDDGKSAGKKASSENSKKAEEKSAIILADRQLKIAEENLVQVKLANEYSAILTGQNKEIIAATKGVSKSVQQSGPTF